MLLEDMDVSHGTRSASSGKRGVSVLQCPGWATGTERVTRSYILTVSSLGIEISVTSCDGMREARRVERDRLTKP